MKYLLFIYPNDETWDSDTTNLKIAADLGPISESDEIKFVYGDNHSIFHFDTTLPQDEVTDYIEMIKDDLPEFMFLLIQNSKKVTSNMVDNHLEHLLRINKRGRKPKTNRIKDTFKNFSEDEIIFDIFKQLDKNRKNAEEFLKNESTKLTIDEILDKIIEQGINSLTKGEKRKLDDYSKEQ